MTARQSFAWWSFTATRRPDDPAQFLRDAAATGVTGVEMLPPKWWPAARDAGLALVTLTGHAIETGFNDPRNHAPVGDTVRRAIELAAAGGVAGVIVFSGNRHPGIDDAQGIANTIEGLRPLAAEAHAAGVVLLLELLNSRVDHPNFQCDRSDWGFAVVRAVDSPGLRVLYDGYHMQMMEGNLSPTIASNIDLIGHIHTAGAPGRRDLDDGQDINWRGVAATLRRVGYAGWIGHEFVPKGEPIAALAQACTLFSS
jgi:hydroxypyruvate isomerase